MATVSATLDADGNLWVDGKIVPPRMDWTRADATTEEDIARHIAEDDAEARADGAKWVCSVRDGLGLTQEAFAKQVGVPVATVRRWEQGKSSPRGAARVLLRVLAREPDAVRRAMTG